MSNKLANHYFNLATLLDAGVPLLRSLDNIAQNSTGHAKRAFMRIRDNASKGQGIAETMKEFPKFFSPLDIALIEAAEASGSLPESLSRMSKWHEFVDRVTRSLKSRMIFPALILVIGAFVAPLPGFFLGGWQLDVYIRNVVMILMMFAVPTAIILGIIYLTPKQGPLRACLDSVILMIPLLGLAMRKLSISRYCWSFHMLYKAGVPVAVTAEKATQISGNAVIAGQLAGGARCAKEGMPLSEGFSPKLGRDFLDVWQIGEESGRMEDTTERLARTNAESAEFVLEELANWLPKVAYGLVGITFIYLIFKDVSYIMSQLNIPI